MSLSATAFLLKEGVRPEHLIEACYDKIIESMIDWEISLIDKSMVLEYDSSIRHKAFVGSFTEFVQSRYYSGYQETLNSESISFGEYSDGSTIVLINASKKGIANVIESSGLIAADISCYTGTDAQVSSGEITEEEWGIRKEFWYKANNRYWPSYKFNTSMRVTAIAQNIIDRYDSMDDSVSVRLEQLAKRDELDHIMKSILPASPIGTPSSKHFQAFFEASEIQASNGDKWKNFLEDVSVIKRLE